jgi:hypothetical protein
MNFNEAEMLKYFDAALNEAHYLGKVTAIDAVVTLALMSTDIEHFRDQLLAYYELIEKEHKKKILCEN